LLITSFTAGHAAVYKTGSAGVVKEWLIKQLSQLPFDDIPIVGTNCELYFKFQKYGSVKLRIKTINNNQLRTGNYFRFENQVKNATKVAIIKKRGDLYSYNCRSGSGKV